MSELSDKFRKVKMHDSNPKPKEIIAGKKTIGEYITAKFLKYIPPFSYILYSGPL